MGRKMASIRKPGFTLIEVLVTVVVIGVLAAVVIPAVTAQVTAGDSARVLEDMNNIRTGSENFQIALRQFPGDVDDLVSKPGTQTSSTNSPGTGTQVDQDLAGVVFTSPSQWNGPYIEATLPSTIQSSTSPSPSGAAFTTGYNATINNKFLSCAIDASSPCSGTSANYLVAEIDGLTVAQAQSINDLIDGVGEASSGTAGKFRALTNASGTNIGYYFATPYK